ncbi:MAG: hypothetical protein U1A27_14350 [Phycisphaerae bacterium]
MNWLSIGIFFLQTVLELSSNIITNFAFGILDTLFDPLDILLSGVLTFVRR